MFQVRPGDEEISFMHQRCIHMMPRYEGCWSCSHPVQTARANRPAQRPVKRVAAAKSQPVACGRCFTIHAGEC